MKLCFTEAYFYKYQFLHFMVNRTWVLTCILCGVGKVSVVLVFLFLTATYINKHFKKKKGVYYEKSFSNEQMKYLYILQEGFGLVSNIHSWFFFFPLTCPLTPCPCCAARLQAGLELCPGDCFRRVWGLGAKNSEENLHLLHLSPVSGSSGFSKHGRALVSPCGILAGVAWLPSSLHAAEETSGANFYFG